MKDGQIKQNAEEYADSMKEIRGELEWCATRDDYLAGAHSRDEEIKELQNELESLRKGFYERGDKLKELMLKNNELRNPWISVEEKLPSNPKHWAIKGIVGARIDSGFSYFELFGYVYPKGWVNKELLLFEECNITHWMPIPQIKKEDFDELYG